MYDTVSALWREPSPEFLETFPWYRRTVSKTERGIRETWFGGPKGGVTAVLHPDGVVKFERSLPKALTGQNAVDLRQDEVPDAIAAVDREIAALVPGVVVPSFGSLPPSRADYCESIDLGEPALVDLALERFARMRLARKGYPIRGESGSVNWPTGALRLKAYNKGREDGDPEHRSWLRLEPGLFGIVAFRTLPGLLDLTNPEDRNVTVLHVLTPEVRATIFGRAWSLLGGIPVNTDEMNDVQFMAALLDFFGVRRTASIVGYCSVWALSGVRQPRDVSADNRVTYYRVLADIRRFRDHHSELGRAPVATEDLPRWLVTHTGLAA